MFEENLLFSRFFFRRFYCLMHFVKILLRIFVEFFLGTILNFTVILNWTVAGYF